MKYSRSLVATLLMSGGLLQLAPLALAAGTAAGQPIENTATATYEDPTGAVSNTTSNTVTVTVAEVAGITITAGTVTNTGTTAVTTGNPTAVATTPVAGDNLVFEFDVTNIGNDTTNFLLPNQAQIGNSPATVQKVQYLDGTTWKDVSTLPGGVIAKTAAGGDIIPGAVVKVRVLATVNAGTTTGTINVTYGSTGQTNLQNDPFAPTGGDVYTVDKADTFGAGETAGVPSNGVREAAATGTTVVNPGKQAFVKVSKVAALDPTTAATATTTDDKVTYTLGLEVAGTAPTGTNLVAEDLAGTNITVDGAVVPRILVSDAIPAGATLAATPVAPSTDWTVVYTTSPIGSTTANNVAWSTTQPATLASVTRVGYIKSGTIDKGTATAPTIISGFTLTLNLNLPATGGSVLNIAQAFGTTLTNGAPDPTKPAVDESGDAQYNNLNPDGTPGPTPTNGVATGADGTDPSNSNTGSGTGGEANIVTVVPPAVGGAIPIVNGPENKPAANGPSGSNNDDFTNKSVTIDTTQAGWTNGVPNTVDPQSTGFTNSVSQGAGATRPQFVALLPTPPANATALPDGTIVTIVANGVSVAYTYSSATGFTPVVPGTLPINLTVPVTGNVDYGVEINLPAGTAQMTGFPVSITSFANGAPAVIDPTSGATTFAAVVLAAGDKDVINGTDAQNITIDRLYTGYLRMAKEAQVYKIDGGVTTIVSPFSSSAPKAEPGQYIEYRIKYSNISEPVTGTTNSVGLAANNIKIKENGSTGGNNWATFTTHKPNTAQDGNGVITYDGGAKTNGDTVIGEYLDTVPTLAPGAFGTFTFTRQVK